MFQELNIFMDLAKQNVVKRTITQTSFRNDETMPSLIEYRELDQLTKDTEDGYSEWEPMISNSPLPLSSTSDSEEEQSSTGANAMLNESACNMVVQILVPFLLAGLGTVMAGRLLDTLQYWEVFQTVSEIFILVPALLGLKGNLEMTLASRLSTAVNVGKINSQKEKWNLIIGNLALKQVQATVLGFLAALGASVLGWFLNDKLPINHAVMLCCSSVVTAFIASLLQGIIMVAVIFGSKRTGINPDNIAAPIAASFGDLITLGLLAIISQLFFKYIESQPLVIYAVCISFLSLTPVWVVLSFRHSESSKLLYCGWEPVITAMIISSMGGLILKKSMKNLPGVVIFSPVMNGVGGNLAAIQSSRITTYLHYNCSLGEQTKANGCYCPLQIFYGKGYNSRTARVLLLLAIPGHVVFLYIIYLMQGVNPTVVFITFYLLAAFTQVFILLCIADWMVYGLWHYGRDPDSFSIPYLTAIGDLLGTSLLSLCFYLLWFINKKDTQVGK